MWVDKSKCKNVAQRGYSGTAKCPYDYVAVGRAASGAYADANFPDTRSKVSTWMKCCKPISRPKWRR